MNNYEHVGMELLQWENAKRLHPLEQLFWECTLRCNLNCRHCGSDCKAVSLVKDMPLEDFVPVLDELAEKMDASDVMVVTTGGEPLIRKDILDIGRAIRERGFLWGMVSNGMLLTEDMFGKLTEAGLQSLSLSIDGFEEEHNWMRGNPDSFVDVWNNRFQKFRDREWMKKGECADCKAWELCEGNGMHLRDDDGNLLLCNFHEIGLTTNGPNVLL